MTAAARQGSGAPTFCWHCMRQLQRAPGRRQGLFFFEIVRDQDGVDHRVHAACVQEAATDGVRHIRSQS